MVPLCRQPIAALTMLLLVPRLFAQPVIYSQPANQICIYGGNAGFSVVASNAGPFNCQWQFNETNLPNPIITTFAGNGSAGFSGDGGPATDAKIDAPFFVAVDGGGNVYIADNSNRRVRKVSPNGIINTVAGGGTGGPGGTATSAFLLPTGMLIDAAGNLYLASADSSCSVYKVNTNGIITIFAGGRGKGFSGDGGKATNATLSDFPNGLAMDAFGNLYIADTANSRVRKVDTNGIITTVAGNGKQGYSGDGGTATNASLAEPNGLAFDANGNLLIADYGSGNETVRRVSTNNIITTVAGTGTFGYNGDGILATNASLSGPRDVAVDASGNIYIADFGSDRIRKVDTNGIITTVAGNGTTTYSGDGAAPTSASLYEPDSVKLDTAGNLYISDYLHQRIRCVLMDSPFLTVTNTTPANVGNYQVIVSGTDGSVTSSIASLTLTLPPISASFTQTNGTISLTWAALSGLNYQVEYTTNLAQPDWTILGDPINFTNNEASVFDSILGISQIFYRVQMVP